MRKLWWKTLGKKSLQREAGIQPRTGRGGEKSNWVPVICIQASCGKMPAAFQIQLAAPHEGYPYSGCEVSMFVRDVQPVSQLHLQSSKPSKGGAKPHSSPISLKSTVLQHIQLLPALPWGDWDGIPCSCQLLYPLIAVQDSQQSDISINPFIPGTYV